MESRILRLRMPPFIGAAIAAMVTLTGGSAWATDFKVKGSDTLFDVLTASFAAWHVDGDTVGNPDVAPHTLTYIGGGSGTAETAMTTLAAGVLAPTQSIGGMSRNFKENFIGDPVYGLAPPAPYNTAPTVIPTTASIIGLDAVVKIERNLPNGCLNLAFTTRQGVADIDSPLALILGGKSYLPAQCSSTGRACTMNATTNHPVLVAYDNCSLLSDVCSNQSGGTGTCAAHATTACKVLQVPDCEAPTIKYPNGEGTCFQGAEGTIRACKDPARMQALRDFQACFGGSFQPLKHFIRRDDNSGTTDTMKERLRIKRFCNGAAKPPSPTPDGGNLYAEDLDPIRPPVSAGVSTCMGTPGNWVATTCTNDLDGGKCGATAAPATTCTQGFVMALSEPDVGLSDVTVSIANRVGSDALGRFVGYAGKEAAQTKYGTQLAKMNGLRPEINLVRLGTYFLARRLYLQTGYATADAVRNTVEADFFDWAALRGGRCNTDPFVLQYGFITCSDQCGTNPSPPNICVATPFPPADVINQSCTGNKGAACVGGNLCCTGSMCAAVDGGAGVCPAAPPSSAGEACHTDADCASGLICGQGDYAWDWTCQ